MVKRELIVKTSDVNGNAMDKTYSNVNPNATAANIDTCARTLIGLSTNTYIDTLKVDTESINEALAE